MTDPLQYRDTISYLRMVRRMVRAAGRRVAEDDPEILPQLIALRRDLDEAIRHSVQVMQRNGATWQEIGDATGTTRQAAFQKWANG